MADILVGRRAYVESITLGADVGGALAGGTAPSNLTRRVVTAGGVLVGGLADVSTGFLGNGGVSLSGTATVAWSSGISPTPFLGLVVDVGGSADVSFAQSYDAAGGALVGGSATVTLTSSNEGIGGVVAGGNVLPISIALASSDGGIQASGVSPVYMMSLSTFRILNLCFFIIKDSTN